MNTKRFSTIAGGSLAMGTALLLLSALFFLLLPPQATAAPEITADLFFSEYVEGSSNNKALEIYNGTGAEANLSEYVVELYPNGNTTPNSTLTLSDAMATLTDGEVLVIANSSADAAILDEADITSSVTFFNGNDAVVLKHNGTIIDMIGIVGDDTYWGSGEETTSEATLRRLPDVCQGDADGFDDPTDLTNEWEGFPQNTFDGLGDHTTNCGGPEVLLTELTVTPTEGEFVEIYNPGSTSVNLSDFYLTDATFAPGSTYYYNIVTGLNAGGGGFADFHARFPDGASIDPGEYQMVALNGSDSFSDTYGFLPTYELFEDGATADAVADMREAFAGSINDQGGLTNGGEMVVLYYWNGTSDLVTDMDYTVWGDKDEAVDKSGVSIDGPDADVIPSTYLTETGIVNQEVLATGSHEFGNSWQRRDLSEGTEATAGGNGINGEDETSENFSDTWCEAVPSPGAPANCAAPGSDLAISKFGPEALTDEAGQQVVYTIVIENQSPISATDLVVTDNLPDGLHYQSDNAEVNPVAAGNNVYIWMLPDLAAMSSTSFQITATTGAFPLAAGTIFTNTVEVDTTLPGDDPANNVAETAATVFPLVYIHDIQGSGDSTPMPGAIVNIEAIVVGDFQDNDGDLFDTDLDGFFVQEQMADYDDDSTTSEGVFVYAPGAIDVGEGDVVCLTGEVGEYSDQTQLTLQSDVKICGESALPAPVPLTLPVSDLSDFEHYEGMLVTFPQALVISEYYNYDRYNEVVLAEPFVDERPFTPSAYLDPTTEAAAIADAMSLTARSRITLDDARSAQNPPLLRHPNGAPYTLVNRFRGGDRVQDATGVLGEGFGLYRLQPTAAATYLQENERPDSSPAVGGSVQVSAFNVLNYFLTLDDGSDICGPNLDMECRGADTQEEFDRQRAKILAALEEIEADVFGLVELENTTGVTPTADLAAGLNDALGAGTYAHIETGTIGGDAIKLGIIYKPATVTPLGDFAVLDDPEFLDPNNTGVPKNRAALVQTFQDNHTGETFTVVVNHLKSKGSDCGGPPDDDPVQGNCNLTRAMAADYLVDWLATNPTETGMGNNLIIGDLNAYDKEDPIDEILEGPDDTLGTDDDYGDLLFQFQGEYAYSYVFDGQFGYLDYAMASQQLLPQVTGAGTWHINADESDVLDYDMSFKPDEQEALFAADPFRASDHDPVIVGLFKLRVYLPAVFN